MSKHIGIVAVSPEGSALCYRAIFRGATAMLGSTGHPKVTLHNEPLEDYVAAARANDWMAVAEMLRRSARILAAAGADFCILPDNLMQNGVQLAEVGSPIPWLNMTSLVAEAVAASGHRSVGLIGTSMVMFGSTYQSVLGLRGVQVLVPDAEDPDAIDRVIFSELIHGVCTPASQQRLMAAIWRLAARGCEGIILGCSEAPLAIHAQNCPIPLYDPTALLADGALRRCIAAAPVA